MELAEAREPILPAADDERAGQLEAQFNRLEAALEAVGVEAPFNIAGLTALDLQDLLQPLFHQFVLLDYQAIIDDAKFESRRSLAHPLPSTYTQCVLLSHASQGMEQPLRWSHLAARICPSPHAAPSGHLPPVRRQRWKWTHRAARPRRCRQP